MNWYHSFKDDFIDFFSNELNRAPAVAAVLSYLVGFICGYAAYQIFLGDKLSMLSLIAGVAVVAYSIWGIRGEYAEWSSVFGVLTRRDKAAFMWAVWPNFLIGLVVVSTLVFLNSILSVEYATKVALTGILAAGLLVFCGWFGTNTARHIVNGGQIRWGGIR
jgi:hypothetical protein